MSREYRVEVETETGETHRMVVEASDAIEAEHFAESEVRAERGDARVTKAARKGVSLRRK